MHADLDALLTALYVLVDDSLPKRRGGGRPPKASDAEIICLAVAQILLDHPCDRRFLAIAGSRLGHLFPRIPKQPGSHKRVRRLTPLIVRALEAVALDAPSTGDQLRLLDSTPIPCAASRTTVRRSALAGIAGYGYCASHSRYFWGSACTSCAPPTGCHSASSWPPPTRPNATSPPKSSSASNSPAPPSSPTRASPAPTSNTSCSTSAVASSAPTGATSPTATAPRRHPPMDRSHHLDRQRQTQPGTPPRPHPDRPVRPHQPAPARPGRRHLAQLPNRPPPRPLPHPLRPLGINDLGRRRERNCGVRQAIAGSGTQLRARPPGSSGLGTDGLAERP